MWKEVPRFYLLKTDSLIHAVQFVGKGGNDIEEELGHMEALFDCLLGDARVSVYQNGDTETADKVYKGMVYAYKDRMLSKNNGFTL